VTEGLTLTGCPVSTIRAEWLKGVDQLSGVFRPARGRRPQAVPRARVVAPHEVESRTCRGSGIGVVRTGLWATPPPVGLWTQVR